MEGTVPVIEDSRVSFFKGWFSKTLPQYVLPPHERLFVNFDADLYSSTKTALDFLRPHISFGTICISTNSRPESTNRRHSMSSCRRPGGHSKSSRLAGD